MLLIGKLVICRRMLDFMRFRFPIIHRFTLASRRYQPRDAKVKRRNMRGEVMAEEKLMAKTQKKGVEDLAVVKRICVEAAGEISLVRTSEPGALV